MTSAARTLSRSTALILLSLSLGTFTYGQTSRITGNVFGSDRRPVSDAFVELLNELGSTLMRQRTGGGGEYSFSGLSSGRFTIRVRPFGTNYEEQSQEVEIVTYVGGRQIADMQQKDFYLKLRKTASNRPLGNPGTIFAQDVPDAAKKLYDSGVEHLDGNRVDAGLKDLTDAITAFPDYYAALERLGLEQIKLGKLEDARNRLEKAVAVNERSSNCWYGLSYAYYGLNQIEKAVNASKKAATLSPNSPEIALFLGIALRKNTQFIESEAAMQNAVKLSEGTLADAHWNLALLYTHNLKKFKEAADELEKYLKLKPDHPNATLLREQIKRNRAM
jgi:tetratricopeptide (TPR) repeat protein